MIILARSLAISIAQRSYLNEDHGGDLLGRELLGLTEVLDLNHGGVASRDDLERP